MLMRFSIYWLGMPLRYSSASAMKVAYGIDVNDSKHELVVLEENFIKAFEEAFAPGKYLVESFSILQYIPMWFPGAKFHQDAAGFRRIFTDGMNKPFDVMLEKMVLDFIPILVE